MEQSFNDPEVVENGSHSYEINNIRNPEDGYCSSKEYEIFSLDGLSKYRHRISQDGGDALGDEEICCSDDSEVFEGGFDRNANFNVKDDTPEEESRFAKNSDSNGSKVFDVLNEGSLNKSGSDRQNIITNKVLASHAVGDDVNAFIEPWEVDQATPSCCSEQFKYPAKTENSESGVAINPTPCEQDLNFRDCEIKDAKDCSEIVFDEAGKECGVDVSSTKEKLFLKIDETKDRSDEEEKSCVTESVNENIGGMNLVCDQNKITVSGTIATEINENEDFSVLPRNSCDADREKTEDCLMKEDAITTKDATIFNPNEDEFLNLPVVVDVRSGAEAKGTDGKVDGATDCENESRSKESADICHFSELSDKSTGSDHLWKKSVSLYSESNGTSQFIEPKDTFDNTDFVVDIDKPGCRDRNSNSLDIALWSPSSEGVNTDNGSEHSGSVVSSDALDEVFVETLLEKVNLSFDQKQEPNSIGKNETENGIHPGNCENKGVGLKSIVLKNSDIEQKEHCDNELEHSMEKHTHKDGDKSIRDEGLPEVSPRMARRPGEYFQCLAASHHDGGKGHNRVDFCVVGDGNLCKESAEDLKVENTSRCPSGNESIRDEGLPVLSLRAAHRPAECFQNLAASRQDRDEGHSEVDFCVVGDGNSCKEFAGDAQADNRSSNPSDSNGYPVENLDSFEACHEGNDQENSAIHRRTSERETLRSNSSLTSLDQNLDESDGENHQTCEMHVDNSIEEPRFDIINIVNLDNNRAKDRMESGGDDIEYPDKSIGDGRMLAKQVAQKALNFESNMKDINDNIHKDNEKIASFFETCLVKPVERSHRSVFDLEDSDQDHVEFSSNLEDNEEEEGTCSSRTLSADESHMETVGDETHLMDETGSSNCSLSAVDQEQDDFNSKTSVSTESFVDDVEKGYSSNSAWTCTSQETGDQSGDQNVADGGTNQEADLQTGETNLFASNRKRKRNSKGLKVR